MNEIRLSSGTLRKAAFLGALGVMVSSQGCAKVVGIESDPTVAAPTCVGTLSVRIASDFSGTATDIAIPYFFGQYDYLRKLNETGGVMGCRVDIGVADNKYTPAETSNVVDAWRKDPSWANVNTVFIFGTGPTTTAGPSVMAEKKVIIPGSYAGSLATPQSVDKSLSYPLVNDLTFTEISSPDEKKSAGWPYVFFPATDYSTGIRLAIQAAWEIQPGRMAMAHETADKCAYCVDPLTAGRTYLKNLQGMALGRDLVIPQTSAVADEPTIDAAVQKYFFGDPANNTNGQLGGEVGECIANPEYQPTIWFWSGNSVFASSVLGKALWKVQNDIQDTVKYPSSVIPDSVRNNFKTKWKLRVMANNWGIGETTPGTCGPACNNDNFYGLFPVPRYADIQNAALMNDVIALHDEFAAKDSVAAPPIPARTADQYRDVRYVQGYVAAFMWRKGMEAAIMAGHRNPTGEDLKNALETFASLDMQGMTAAPISFSPQDHRPQSGEVVYKLDANGQFTFVNKFNIPLVADWLGW